MISRAHFMGAAVGAAVALILYIGKSEGFDTYGFRAGWRNIWR